MVDGVQSHVEKSPQSLSLKFEVSYQSDYCDAELARNRWEFCSMGLCISSPYRSKSTIESLMVRHY